MYRVAKCYKCGHYVVFRKTQKTVLCRRCNRTLQTKNMIEEFYTVSDAAKAGKLVAELESKDKTIGFGTFNLNSSK